MGFVGLERFFAQRDQNVLASKKLKMQEDELKLNRRLSLIDLTYKKLGSSRKPIKGYEEPVMLESNLFLNDLVNKAKENNEFDETTEKFISKIQSDPHAVVDLVKFLKSQASDKDRVFKLNDLPTVVSIIQNPNQTEEEKFDLFKELELVDLKDPDDFVDLYTKIMKIDTNSYGDRRNVFITTDLGLDIDAKKSIDLSSSQLNDITGLIVSQARNYLKNNPNAADGGQAGDTTEEIRQNTISTISAQQRSVTLDDYIVRALSMPSEFGTIAKAYIEKPKLTDEQVSTIETLNLFTLSQNTSGQFSTPTQTLKKNLRTYLSHYRIIGDNIEIKDAFIINIAVDFEIIVLPNFNNNDVILSCINSLKTYFARDNWQINQPILLRDLFVRLDRINGVQTVKDIKITNKAGTTSGYSQYAYDISSATQNQVIYPSLDPSIFEVKYPNSDIKGRVVPL